MARPIEYADGDIESVIDDLIREGIPLKTHRVRLRLGGGNSSRIARLIEARSGALPASARTLPVEIADDFERAMGGVSTELHALIGRAWAEAHKAAAQECGTQAEQTARELTQAREDLDEAVDELLAAQSALRSKEAVIHDLQSKVEGEMAQRLRAEGQVTLLCQQLEEATRGRQGARPRAIEAASPAAEAVLTTSPPAAATEPTTAVESPPAPNPAPVAHDANATTTSPPPESAAETTAPATAPDVQPTAIVSPAPQAASA